MNEENKMWAIVELFGHTVMAGQISKCEIADFVQINVPEVDSIPSWSKIINPKAIYSLTPVTEEVARERAGIFKNMPIHSWDTETMVKNKLSELIEEGKVKLIGNQNNDTGEPPW